MFVYKRYMSLYQICRPVTCHVSLVIVLLLDKGSLIMYICHLSFVIVFDYESYATYKLHNVGDTMSRILYVMSLHML